MTANAVIDRPGISFREAYDYQDQLFKGQPNVRHKKPKKLKSRYEPFAPSQTGKRLPRVRDRFLRKDFRHATEAGYGGGFTPRTKRAEKRWQATWRRTPLTLSLPGGHRSASAAGKVPHSIGCQLRPSTNRLRSGFEGEHASCKVYAPHFHTVSIIKHAHDCSN
jgi:hypothetical protein